MRHHPFFKHLPLWHILRPPYNIFLSVVASKKGLERTMNGTDSIRLCPQWRGIQESYEALVWKSLMGAVRAGDVIVDVGAFIGLYTISLAKRVGHQGFVLAFEPEPANFEWLRRHVVLNHVGDRVKISRLAVGDQEGEINFISGKASQSCVGKNGGNKVPITTLDQQLKNRRVDLMKIDTEGYEEAVLRGGLHLLKDPSRAPRLIYIEVHPYAWKELGTSSESLLSLLKECSYKVTRLDGQPVDPITSYGEVIAYKEPFLPPLST